MRAEVWYCYSLILSYDNETKQKLGGYDYVDKTIYL